MQRAISGNVNHSDIVDTLANHGNVCLLLGKVDEAETIVRERLEMKRSVHGQSRNHPSIANTLNILGITFLSLGELDEAEMINASVSK